MLLLKFYMVFVNTEKKSCGMLKLDAIFRVSAMPIFRAKKIPLV